MLNLLNIIKNYKMLTYIFDALMVLGIASLVAIVIVMENQNAKIRVGRKTTTVRDYLFPPLLPVHMSPAISTMPLKGVSVEDPMHMRI
jgi:hypothetical protein